MKDLSGREIAVLSPLLALMIWIGVHPTPFLERMEPSLRTVLERVEAPNRAELPVEWLDELPTVVGEEGRRASMEPETSVDPIDDAAEE